MAQTGRFKRVFQSSVFLRRRSHFSAFEEKGLRARRMNLPRFKITLPRNKLREYEYAYPA